MEFCRLHFREIDSVPFSLLVLMPLSLFSEVGFQFSLTTFRSSNQVYFTLAFLCKISHVSILLRIISFHMGSLQGEVCSGQEYGYTMSTWYYPTYRTGNVASHIIPISLTNPLVCRVGFYDPSEHFGASYALPGYIAALRIRSTYLTQVRSEPLARVFFIGFEARYTLTHFLMPLLRHGTYQGALQPLGRSNPHIFWQTETAPF